MPDETPRGFFGRWKRRLAKTADATEPQAPARDGGDGASTVLSTSELKTDTVGRVYAEALLELAREQGKVDELADEVRALMPLIDEDSELSRLLTNPAIGDGERAKIVERVFSGKVSDLLYKMFRVLSDKDRLGSLPQVAAGYLLAVARERGEIEVEAFIASELDSAAAAKVAERIGEALGKTVSLRQRVDPALIGGLKIKIGDQLIDASVASQLRSMKNKMIAAGRG
jgi:F-type H+-transporting ATPase subunit delta